ncbi:uncharacterized protein FSUBG_13874 [Fusarium subglutinans]|uniref:Fungal N-terminal domain-containing protein n=1 Tax=Gibberella subglutinans TaxID=42677 RepID=A0A8H5KJZ5_GIBSU|nr:uncharacterized protein FSUBG_13874 [Fusarium subglutinans]KAF5575669.1 hypothetical protein FSUBG_13874 [Fusarium subglutinans]
MAELALAIIPLGITVTSGLVKYLKAFNDHDDDRTRLVRQAERFSSTFQSLEAVLKRSRSNPELSLSVSEASGCLGECQKALQELDTLQHKIFATAANAAPTTHHAHTKAKIKDGYKKLIYPLLKSDIGVLGEALNGLSTTLDLVLGILHLDEQSLTREILNQQMADIQRNTIINSNTSTAIEELRQPISQIDLALPVLQTSLDSVIPHFNDRFDQISYQISYQHAQMQAQIQALLDTSEPARYQDLPATSPKRLYDRSEGQNNYFSAFEIDQETSAFAKRADSVSVCSCLSRRMRQRKRAAIHRVAPGTFVPASIYRQLNAEYETSAPSYTYLSYLHDRRGLFDYHYLNQSVASSLLYGPVHYGPLGLAIIRNNLQEVERIISLHPNILKEVSYYKETPLHIAIYRLDILKVLAKQANPEDWIQCSLDGVTVLSLAMQLSREICNSGEISDESSCMCTLPLRIILAAGCPIIPYRDFRRLKGSFSPEEYFFKAFPHCKILLSKELRCRRRQLRDLAKNNLSITEFSNFTTLEEVPDTEAIDMDRLLRQKGILSLGLLSTFVDLPQQHVRFYSRSIFLDLTSPGDADLFIDSGFKIIDFDQDHDSSLDRALLARVFPKMRFISLDYAIWLFEHHAPLWKWSYRFTSPMPSAFVLADILGIQDYKYLIQDKTSEKAEKYLGESVLVDNCTCLCSPDGCTPFALRMKWLANPHHKTQDHTPQDIAKDFGCYVETYGKDLDIDQHVIMVQQATFAALELRHTCLDRPAYNDWPSRPEWIYWLDSVTELEPDEMEFEFLNVDVEARNQLEEVVVMFQDFVLTGDQTTISAKADSSVSNELSVVGIADLYYRRVLEFWQHIWANRIQDALDAVAKGWDDRFDGMNDLVRISTCEETVQEARDSLEEGDDDEIFNRIIQQMQDI